MGLDGVTVEAYGARLEERLEQRRSSAGDAGQAWRMEDEPSRLRCRLE